MPLARDPAQVPQRGRRDSATGYTLGESIADLRGPMREVVQVEAADNLVVFVDEHVKRVDTAFLVGQQRAIALSELGKEIVTTIADELAEVGPVALLEREDRGFVIGPEPLEVKHRACLTETRRHGDRRVSFFSLFEAACVHDPLSAERGWTLDDRKQPATAEQPGASNAARSTTKEGP